MKFSVEVNQNKILFAKVMIVYFNHLLENNMISVSSMKGFNRTIYDIFHDTEKTKININMKSDLLDVNVTSGERAIDFDIRSTGTELDGEISIMVNAICSMEMSTACAMN